MPSLIHRLLHTLAQLAATLLRRRPAAAQPHTPPDPIPMSFNYQLTSETDEARPMADLLLRFADLPLHRIGFTLTDAEVDRLATHYADRVFRGRRTPVAGKLVWDRLLLRFHERLFVQLWGQGREWAEIYAAEPAAAEALHQELAEYLRRSEPATKEALPPSFFMLTYDGCDFETERIEQMPPPVEDSFLRLCYGEDVLSWVEGFREKTTARTGGLTILQGAPGTGKTSLITQMIGRLAETHVFYVLPVAADRALTAPEFVPFWQKQNRLFAEKVKVIVLEDAERLLWARRSDNREAVSSLLNIADGLTGRMMRLHILCSINARLADLDSAILRPGRLMNYRDFQLLPRGRAYALAEAKSLPFLPPDDRQQFALAEVLNPGAWEAPSRPRIGFAA